MHQPIHALLVDDEASALQILQGMLAECCPQVKVIGTAANLIQAVHFCQQNQPNVVFLDIEMPPLGDGFDFIRLSQPNTFGVIVTTAYPDYALRAIRLLQPWDYLVKPYGPAELMASVQIAQQKLPTLPQPASPPQGLMVTDQRQGNVALRLSEVLYFVADHATVDVVVFRQQKEKRFTVYRPLKEFETELAQADFCRTHHRYLVNLAWVERYERTGRNGLIHLTNGTRVEISVQKMDDFVARFEAYIRGK